MRLILPEGDLYALRTRIEAQFGIRLAVHDSDMRGGPYLRWPRLRIPMLERLNPFARERVPPFESLLVYWNSEAAFDAEPFFDWFSMRSFVVELSGEASAARDWFMVAEGGAQVGQ